MNPYEYSTTARSQGARMRSWEPQRTGDFDPGPWGPRVGQRRSMQREAPGSPGYWGSEGYPAYQEESPTWASEYERRPQRDELEGRYRAAQWGNPSAGGPYGPDEEWENGRRAPAPLYARNAWLPGASYSGLVSMPFYGPPDDEPGGMTRQRSYAGYPQARSSGNQFYTGEPRQQSREIERQWSDSEELPTMQPPWSDRNRDRHGPKGYARSDERVREDICDEFMRNHAMDPSEIDVTCEEGVVTMRGEVDSRNEKFMAERIASSVLGVLDVNNQLRIRRPARVPHDETNRPGAGQRSSAAKDESARPSSLRVGTGVTAGKRE